jgi:hypothetical protein
VTLVIILKPEKNRVKVFLDHGVLRKSSGYFQKTFEIKIKYKTSITVYALLYFLDRFYFFSKKFRTNKFKFYFSLNIKISLSVM